MNRSPDERSESGQISYIASLMRAAAKIYKTQATTDLREQYGRDSSIHVGKGIQG